MKKIFISQPMAGKTDEQILDERQKAIESVKLHFGKENVEVIDSFITEAPKDAKPLWYLGKSLELMSCADIAVFIGDWRNYRGCNIEYMAAIAYDIELFHFINENKEKCPHCGEAVGADWNFCMYCGGKVKNTCDCWVLNKPYDCGQGMAGGVMQEQDKDEIIPVDEEAMQRVYEANRKANEKWHKEQRLLDLWTYANAIFVTIALIVLFLK